MKEKRLGSFNCSTPGEKGEVRNMPDYVYAAVLMKKEKVKDLER
jgi:hypothetical protein